MSKRFKRQDYFRYKRLGTKWRRPRGRQSKMRRGKGGAGDMPRIGYGTPPASRGKIRGLEAVSVATLNDLANAKQAIIISSAVGEKKRSEIAKAALEKGLVIINASRAKRAMRSVKKKKQERELARRMEDLKKKEEAATEKAKKAKAAGAQKKAPESKEAGKEKAAESKEEATTEKADVTTEQQRKEKTATAEIAE